MSPWKYLHLSPSRLLMHHTGWKPEKTCFSPTSILKQRSLPSTCPEYWIRLPLNNLKVSFYSSDSGTSYGDGTSDGTSDGMGISSSYTNNGTETTTKKSLVFTSYFYHPSLKIDGVECKGYNVLSTATAFLLAIEADGHDTCTQGSRNTEKNEGEYNNVRRGPNGRTLMEVNWLGFAPKKFRPQVHVVCSSHVVSPFLWNKYYNFDWLQALKQDNVVCTVDVMKDNVAKDTENSMINSSSSKSIAKFALNSQPYHHPDGYDVALIHFKNEKSALEVLKRLGVEVLHLRNSEKLHKKGDKVFFDGYIAREINADDSPPVFDSDKEGDGHTLFDKGIGLESDQYLYDAHIETGQVICDINKRLYAKTPKPLLEGMCGAPVLDEKGYCCGAVEGHVPLNFKNKRLAGSAAFTPAYIMKPFLEYVERELLKNILPKNLFQLVVHFKKSNSVCIDLVNKGVNRKNLQEANLEESYNAILTILQKEFNPEVVHEILMSFNLERIAVLKILNKEDDANIHEAISCIQTTTIQLLDFIKDQYTSQQNHKRGNNP